MVISNRFILHQGPVIAGLFRTVSDAIRQGKKRSGEPFVVPTPEIVHTLPPRAKDLVSTYVRHVGGDPSQYRNTLPAHLFPQWSFPIAAQTLVGVPYPLLKVVNGGCRLELNAPLPNNEPLIVRASLNGINDNGRRAVLHQKIITETKSVPNALVSHIYAIVPTGKKRDANKVKRGERMLPRVPNNVRELAFWKLSRSAGLDFAKLTGDFNPIHWIPAYAKASGFRSTILHGFGTFARAMEGLNGTLCAGSARIETFDVKFTRPLVLPGKVGLYVDDENNVYVGDAPGGPAYMVGNFTLTKKLQQRGNNDV